jgi:hypothetical protein
MSTKKQEIRMEEQVLASFSSHMLEHLTKSKIEENILTQKRGSHSWMVKTT